MQAFGSDRCSAIEAGRGGGACVGRVTADDAVPHAAGDPPPPPPPPRTQTKAVKQLSYVCGCIRTRTHSATAHSHSHSPQMSPLPHSLTHSLAHDPPLRLPPGTKRLRQSTSCFSDFLPLNALRNPPLPHTHKHKHTRRRRTNLGATGTPRLQQAQNGTGQGSASVKRKYVSRVCMYVYMYVSRVDIYLAIPSPLRRYMACDSIRRSRQPPRSSRSSRSCVVWRAEPTTILFISFSFSFLSLFLSQGERNG